MTERLEIIKELTKGLNDAEKWLLIDYLNSPEIPDIAPNVEMRKEWMRREREAARRELLG